jgi:hypothetical protein
MSSLKGVKAGVVLARQQSVGCRQGRQDATSAAAGLCAGCDDTGQHN